MWAIILIIAVLVIIVGLGIFTSIAMKKSPLLTAQAKVFAKTTKTSSGGISGDSSGNYSTYSDITEHFVSFEFDNRRENVAVDVSVYNTLSENDTGLLEYKEIAGQVFYFVSFKRD